MNTTASILLLVVAVMAVLAGVGSLWALKALPKPHSRSRRRSSRSKKLHAAAPALTPPAGADENTEPSPSHAQTHQERIEAMRALLHRGDEKARRQAARDGVPQFADTMALDDDVSPPTLPLGRRPGDPEPGSGKRPPAASSTPNSGHIPL